ncbi:MAG: hypothetical protein NTY26_15915 [Burkholderiales bacterium]|nr:hypothetical protein [Burkholderiales bacterium]
MSVSAIRAPEPAPAPKVNHNVQAEQRVREAAAEKPQQAKQQPVTKSQDETRGRHVDRRA